MPQMAPMNWLMLFLMFIVIFMTFNSLNYFMFKNNNKNESMNKKKVNINWKW